MNLEVKEKWIKALTSGKYNQARNKLRTDSGYCCLGVLCDIYINETGAGEWVTSGKLDIVFFKDARNIYYVTLPDLVMAWAGLSSTSPELPSNDLLEELNDTGVSFTEIARLIEEQL